MNKNREEAKALGYKTYQGPPCQYGHGTDRLTSNGACPSCQSIRTARWGRFNPEKRAEYNRNYKSKKEG